MTVTRRNSGAKFSRVARSLKLSKTAAAVRAGLLTTTAMFALAGANAAFAQTCTPAVPGVGATVTCSGAFTDSVNLHFTDNTDITVILDDTVTVDPAVGMVGIDLSAPGDITLDSSGVFNVDSADAIYVSGTTSATVGVYGDVYNYALDNGDNALDVYSPGDIAITVGSSLSTYGDAGTAYTLYALSDAGDIVIDLLEYSTVDASSNTGSAQAVSAYAYNGGSVDITNAGDVYATSNEGSTWAVWTYASGDDSLSNTGNIVATSYAGSALGVRLYAYDGDAYAYNGGYIAALSTNDGANANALAVYAYSYNGYTDVVNSGDIVASATTDNTASGANAQGIYAYSYLGTTVDNSGSVSATIYGYYGNAYGVYATSYNDTEVNNSGSIYAASTGYYGYATGVFTYGYDSTVNNAAGGDITAYAYYGTATGALAVAYNEATINNSGDIYASAASGYAYGAVAYGYTATINNDGYIGAVAGGYYDVDLAIYAPAYAYGAVATGYYATINNSGDIYAGVTYGTAVGAEVFGAYGDINNSGYIGAYAYYGTAVGAIAIGLTDSYVYNDGDIVASAHYGTSIGVYAASAVYAGVHNTENGSIYAYTYAGAAMGVNVYSLGDAGVVNYGDITAYGVIGLGAGVYADVANSLYIYNAGSIAGYGYPGYGVGYSILSVGSSYDHVVNVGSLTGSIYLGDGDDTIDNYGDIYIGDGQFIDMGTSVNAGANYIYNAGTIHFTGSTGIYMGGGTLYNSGTLNLQDGSGDTYLYMEGNLAGDGSLDMEIDGTAGINDYMYIYGNVDAASTTTVNIDLLTLPTAESTVYDMIGVSGDSVAGNFVLGSVDFQDNNFLDLEFSWIADIDPTNATPDVFSLGIEVVGLSDPGTLVASIPGALLSMTNTEVGTWRQRMGVIDSYRAHSLSLWARVFQSKGDFSPDHFNDGFGQGGNFDWNQKNTGMEAGIDFAVTDELSLGILAAQTEADVDLNDGVGNNEIDADTYGVYATWVSNGWYLDASYRWSDFESRLTSIAGPMEINADGETFNIETGYAWVTGSGLKIEPQLQYTHTKIEAIDVALGDLANMAMDDMDSSRGRLGLSFRKDFGDADNGWLFTPYSTLSVVREFDGEARYFITDDFTGFTSVEGTSAMLELGFNARTGNVAVYGGLTWQDGGAIDSFFGGHLGIRYTFGGAAPAPAPVPVVVQKTCAELDDDGDGVNNCDDKCPGSQAGQAIGPDGCPVPAPEPEPVMEPKPYRG